MLIQGIKRTYREDPQKSFIVEEVTGAKGPGINIFIKEPVRSNQFKRGILLKTAITCTRKGKRITGLKMKRESAEIIYHMLGKVLYSKTPTASESR